MRRLGMEDLSLHILDIAENAITAGARTLTIRVTEDVPGDSLSLEIEDDGKGMSSEAVARAHDPFYTTRTERRVGLGLAFLREAAAAANGSLEIRSAPGSGTTVKATFQHSHIDRKPLGSMAETIVALVAARADIDVHYTHRRGGRTVVLDTKEIRRQLADIPLNSADVLRFIRNYVNQEEHSLSL